MSSSSLFDDEAEPVGSQPEARWFELDPTPVLVVNEEGMVVASNPAGRRLLQERTAATVRARRLVFAQSIAQRAFMAALDRITTGAASHSTVVLRSDDGQWRRLDLLRCGGTAFNGAFVTLRREPEQQIDITPLVEAFRLSAAESKILAHLAEGLAPKRIASRLDVSPNTVRAHLRSLYLKMNVRGINDLIRECTRLTD